MRMVAESEKVHGDEALLREPQIVKPATPERSTAVAPRVSAASVLAELADIEREIATVRALITDETKAREWETASGRIERIVCVASQAARWARVLAMRGHVALK